MVPYNIYQFLAYFLVSGENANFVGKSMLKKILENETDHASKIIQHIKYAPAYCYGNDDVSNFEPIFHFLTVTV